MFPGAAGPSDRAAGRASPRPVFVARGLSKDYRMGEVEVHALRGVDLDLYEGEFVVLLGPSGSGKSTLLNILGGLDVPTAGSVRYLDRELTAGGDAALTRFRREHVGFVFQFYNLIPSLTARENVALVTEIAARPMTPEEALRLVGLGDRMDHFPSQLSGGEQQRVNVIADLLAPPGERSTLGDGFRVEAAIVVWEAADVLKVPASALFGRGDGWGAFVVADGRAILTPVEVGHSDGRETEIRSGLTPGATVVYPGEEIADGAAVAVR